MAVELHDRVTLNCSATGNPTPSIRWYKDGKAIVGPRAIGNVFVISEATPNERGFYQCEAFSSFGKSSRSTEAKVVILGRCRSMVVHCRIAASVYLFQYMSVQRWLRSKCDELLPQLHSCVRS